MSSLKEIKTRIASVRSTLQITSAMKMVAAAKLHHAQQAISGMLPYEAKLHGILAHLLSSQQAEGQVVGGRLMAGAGFTPQTLPEPEKVSRVALVAFSSNSSLCGGFNTTAIRNLMQVYDNLVQAGYSAENIDVYTVGKRISDAARLRKMSPVTQCGDMGLATLADKPSYNGAARFAEELVKRYSKGEVGQVVLLYNHYASNAAQPPVMENYLPLCVTTEGASPEALPTDLIVEPDVDSVVESLLPKVLSLKIYSVMLDANAAEHAARTVAMQMASDNASKLLDELTLAYNKSRQQKITSEILDLMGGMRQ